MGVLMSRTIGIHGRVGKGHGGESQKSSNGELHIDGRRGARLRRSVKMCETTNECRPATSRKWNGGWKEREGKTDAGRKRMAMGRGRGRKKAKTGGIEYLYAGAATRTIRIRHA